MALAAARGSTRDLERVESFLNQHRPSEESRFFLPVFYANLDPAGIPSIGDTPSNFTAGAIMRASISLRCLYKKIILGLMGAAAFADLWLSLCQWARFFDSSKDHYDPALAVGFLDFTAMYRSNYVAPHESEEMASLMSSTPGFRRMLTRAWIVATDEDFAKQTRCSRDARMEPTMQSIRFTGLTNLLFSQMRPTSRQHVDEIIDGAGRGVSGLARLVVLYIDRLSPESLGFVWTPDERLEGRIFDFVDDVDRFLAEKKFEENSPRHFDRALLLAGVIPSVAFMASILTRLDPKNKLTKSIPPFSPLVQRSVIFLNRMLRTTHGHHYIPDAISSGLLDLIASCGSAGKCYPALESLLEDVLPSSLVKYYDLADLEIGLLDVSHLCDTAALQASEFSGAWNEFTTVAEERIALRRSSSAQQLKICDNLECSKVGPSSLFKRCSGCYAFYYCSTDCQKADWHEGSHRAYCNPHYSLRLAEKQGFTERERYFFRAMLAKDSHATRLHEGAEVGGAVVHLF
ncbi:hypothetical protein B0H14DRAFT_3164888 [Mycena olivaceomarginata]|nr:hypothetical protein B0H14DRAFT_3164888 [Mycena olivaceomarginata]